MTQESVVGPRLRVLALLRILRGGTESGWASLESQWLRTGFSARDLRMALHEALAAGLVRPESREAEVRLQLSDEGRRYSTVWLADLGDVTRRISDYLKLEGMALGIGRSERVAA